PSALRCAATSRPRTLARPGSSCSRRCRGASPGPRCSWTPGTTRWACEAAFSPSRFGSTMRVGGAAGVAGSRPRVVMVLSRRGAGTGWSGGTEAAPWAYDYETDDGSYRWEEMSFLEVAAFAFTGAAYCNEDQVAAYDKLEEVTASHWGRSFRGPADVRH